MRPISGLSSCAARSRIDECARSAARRFARIWATWIAESLDAPLHIAAGVPLTERPRLVIASGNAGKLREYRDLLADARVQLTAFDTEIEEVGETYRENAALKADAALARSGLASLGDDSGVELEALGGFPGVRSARLGPTQKERTEVLLARLDGIPRPWKARFVCVIALAMPDREPQFFEGECRGEIVPEWRGEAGFGYDPIFLVPGTGKTFGEMPPEEKRKYSHRAAAARALLASGALELLPA